MSLGNQLTTTAADASDDMTPHEALAALRSVRSRYPIGSPDELADREELYEAQRELIEQLIASLLMRPGSDPYALLRDQQIEDEWINDMHAVTRMAADPLSDNTRLALMVRRMVNAAIGRVAVLAMADGQVPA